MNKKVESALAPKAIGPYSQAIVSGNLLFVSGQLPIDSESGAVVEGCVKCQTRKALQNAGAILKEAGFDFKDVVKTTVYLSDIADFGAMNEVYAEFFGEPYPARAAFEVGALPKKEAKVEIDLIAAK